MKELDLDVRRAATARAEGVRFHAEDDQCRCTCGSLLARVVPRGLELKCRKCKALVLITHDELVELYRAVDREPPGGLAQL